MINYAARPNHWDTDWEILIILKLIDLNLDTFVTESWSDLIVIF
jgi:hypothetical protein